MYNISFASSVESVRLDRFQAHLKCKGSFYNHFHGLGIALFLILLPRLPSSFVAGTNSWLASFIYINFLFFIFRSRKKKLNYSILRSNPCICFSLNKSPTLLFSFSYILEIEKLVWFSVFYIIC